MIECKINDELKSWALLQARNLGSLSKWRSYNERLFCALGAICAVYDLNRDEVIPRGGRAIRLLTMTIAAKPLNKLQSPLYFQKPDKVKASYVMGVFVDYYLRASTIIGYTTPDHFAESCEEIEGKFGTSYMLAPDQTLELSSFPLKPDLKREGVRMGAETASLSKQTEITAITKH